jgi:predicted transcriptional regulator
VASERRPLAYTSVLSTMTNLVKKGTLRVEKEHFAHRYWPTCTKGEFEQQVMSRLMGRLIKDLPAPAIQHLVGALDSEDPEILDLMYEEIQRRRRKEG